MATAFNTKVTALTAKTANPTSPRGEPIFGGVLRLRFAGLIFGEGGGGGVGAYCGTSTVFISRG